MNIDGWRQRLQEALEKSGRSKRSISIAAGKGAGYLHSILSEGKEPTIESLYHVCHAINVSMSYILYGQGTTPEDQEFIDLVLKVSPEERKAILTLLRRSLDEDKTK
ncbi:helix-turn-helix domain-containing protein [Bartonella bilalgolemii]|uniref:Helix-turn-helix domain-containing protein n=1 Tax=Bartonella bilalgolemii TaxID=2942911 RepID=A0ABT0P8Z1_9HYPH|nr:helix-turn-helix transcriptional regulator [Bartonella sp. G70]MCL6229223.1 helix-turn-helix domain-containing protein [Bartonella sp. G70]